MNVDVQYNWSKRRTIIIMAKESNLSTTGEGVSIAAVSGKCPATVASFRKEGAECYTPVRLAGSRHTCKASDDLTTIMYFPPSV